MIRTYRYRIKDRQRIKRLNAHARAVNTVWNWCNNAQRHAVKHNQRYPSAFDLSNLAAGSSKLLGLHSQTVQAVCEQYVQSRKERNKPWLRFRGAKAHGWIPFKASGIKLEGDTAFYAKHRFSFWNSRDIPTEAKISVGSFACDASGRWYLNITLNLPSKDSVCPNGEIGLDLGLKERATGSDGSQFKASRFYRDVQVKLAIVQRAGKKRQVRRIHRKIANRRKDLNHKDSTAIAKAYGLIVVGNLSASRLAKTTMAKSMFDQGWSDFKKMLRYKAIGRAGIFLEVNEAHTTRTCSACLARCGPSGLEGLGIREWFCSACDTVHDRDINAAKNILRLGHETLSGGSPVI